MSSPLYCYVDNHSLTLLLAPLHAIISSAHGSAQPCLPPRGDLEHSPGHHPSSLTAPSRQLPLPSPEVLMLARLRAWGCILWREHCLAVPRPQLPRSFQLLRASGLFFCSPHLLLWFLSFSHCRFSSGFTGAALLSTFEFSEFLVSSLGFYPLPVLILADHVARLPPRSVTLIPRTQTLLWLCGADFQVSPVLISTFIPGMLNPAL